MSDEEKKDEKRDEGTREQTQPDVELASDRDVLLAETTEAAEAYEKAKADVEAARESVQKALDTLDARYGKLHRVKGERARAAACLNELVALLAISDIAEAADQV